MLYGVPQYHVGYVFSKAFYQYQDLESFPPIRPKERMHRHNGGEDLKSQKEDKDFFRQIFPKIWPRYQINDLPVPKSFSWRQTILFN